MYVLSFPFKVTLIKRLGELIFNPNLFYLVRIKHLNFIFFIVDGVKGSGFFGLKSPMKLKTSKTNPWLLHSPISEFQALSKPKGVN